jgi:hypothetical protein
MVQGGGASDQIFAGKFNIFGTLALASNYFDGGHDEGTRAGPEQLMDVLTKVRDAAS